MQRIFSVQFSGDANYIFAGSDDTNIRMWKAEASRNIEVVRLFFDLYLEPRILTLILRPKFRTLNVTLSSPSPLA